jgi:uncharacterized delta-60 repeat protein
MMRKRTPTRKLNSTKLNVEILENRTVPSAGALDAAFGAHGLVLSDFGQETRANAMALQSDGKIVVAGLTVFPNSDGSNYALARYNRDGTLDGAFGTGGHVFFPDRLQNTHRYSVSSVIVQPDGNIVAVESSYGTEHNIGLARFRPDGSPDTTFGPNGNGFTSAYPEDILGDQFTLGGEPIAASLQADGKIVLATDAIVGPPGVFDFYGHYHDFLLARFNSDGSLDGGFGAGGMVATTFAYNFIYVGTSPPPADVGHYDAIAYGVALQADGKIVAAGAAQNVYFGGPNKYALARYNADGSLDDTFGAAGRVTTEVIGNPYGASLSSVALQADGKIVAAGSVIEPVDYIGPDPIPTVSKFGVARYNADGTLDTGFGTSGLVATTFAAGGSAAISGIALQADGKIVAAGYSGADPGDGFFTSFAIARYGADGSLDNGFGAGGKIVTSFDPDPSAFSSVAGVVIQPDGNIVAAGTAQTGSGYRDIVLARYLGDPTGAAAPTLAVADAGGIYNGQPFPASATATGANNAAVTGAFAFTYYSGSTASGAGSPDAPTNAGTYTVVAFFTSGDPNYTNARSSPVTFTIRASASLSGHIFEDFNNDGIMDFGEHGIAAVPITLVGVDELGHTISQYFNTGADGAYVFLNLRPGSYTLTETQPANFLQGINSVGTAGGSREATDQFFVQLGEGVNAINYNYGERPAAGGSIQLSQTAGVGFWNNKKGQSLILALNGGGTSTDLANWLAATLPNIYGPSAVSSNLTGKTNAAVAALFQEDFLLKASKLDAQVLATALSVYVTNATLDSTNAGVQYGFTVSGDGVGTSSVNVGSNGDAFGAANNTTLAVLNLLLATNERAVGGWLYSGDATQRSHANNIYSALNQAGGI